MWMGQFDLSGPALVDRWLRQWGPAVFAFFLEGLVCHAIGASDENGIRRRRREGGLLGVGSLNIGARLCRRVCDNDDYYYDEEQEEYAGEMKPGDPPTATDPNAAKKRMNTNSRMAATRIACRLWRLNG